MDDDDRTVEDMIELAKARPDNMGLALAMDDTRGTAQGEGIRLAVDLRGMLVDLHIDDKALALGPEHLAAEISRLTAEASTRALHQGLDVIRYGMGSGLAESIRVELNLPEAPDQQDTEQDTEPAEQQASARPAATRRRRDPGDDEGFGGGGLLVDAWNKG